MGRLDGLYGDPGAPVQPWDPMSYFQQQQQAPQQPQPGPQDYSVAPPPVPPPVAPPVTPPLPSKHQLDYMAEAQRTRDMQLQAIQQTAAAEQAKNAYTANETARAEAVRADHERALAQASNDMYQRIDARQQQIMAEAQKLNDQHVDPSGGFANAPWYAKIGLVVAASLSGALDKRNGPQTGATIINNIIQRNLNAQMQDMARQEKILGFKQQALGMDAARAERFLDARLAAETRMYDGALRLIKANADKLSNPIVAAQAQQLEAGVQQKYMEGVQNYREHMAQLGLQGAQLKEMKRQHDLQWAEGQRQTMLEITRHAQDAATAAALSKAKNDAEQGKHTVWLTSKPGPDPTKDEYVQAPVVSSAAPEQVAKVNEALPELTTAYQIMTRGIKAAEQYSRTQSPADLFAVSAAAQELQANRPFIASVAKGLYGRVSQQELEMVTKAAGDPVAFISRVPAMKAFQENIRLTGENKLHGIGFKGRWNPITELPHGETGLTQTANPNAPPLPPDQQDLQRMRQQALFQGATTDPGAVWQAITQRWL